MANELYSSSYDILEQWLENIAPKYFEVEDTSLLKSSLFGYINEIMANSVEDVAHSVALQYNEIFPNKAVLPTTIYNYAALAKYENFMATPARIKFALVLSKDDIVNLSVASDDSGETRQLTINKFSKLTIDDTYTYILPYDIIIVIQRSKVSGIYDWILSPRYDLTINNPQFELSSPYINNELVNIDDTTYIMLPLYGLQLVMTEYTFSVYSQNLVENIMFTVEYEGHLCYFDVFYVAPNSSEKIQITTYYVSSTDTDEKEYYCYYRYSGTDKIEISFSTTSRAFRPAYNSQVIVDVYTTEGADGNFTYTGTNYGFSFNTQLEYGTNTFDATQMRYYCQLADGISYNGADELDLTELRTNISNEFSNRKNIISENDLQEYFDTIYETSQIKFFKLRNDIIDRIYNAFVLLKSDELGIIPTNTVEMVLYEDDFTEIEEDGTKTILAGQLITVKDADLNFYQINHDTYTFNEIVEIENDPNQYMYGNLFLIKMRINPILVSYYLNSVFDSYDLKCTYTNVKVVSEYICTNVSVHRNAMMTIGDTSDDHNKYTISVRVYMSDVLNYETTVVRGVLVSGDEETVLGYFKFNPETISTENSYVDYTATLTTNDYVNTEDSIKLNQSIYKANNVSEILLDEFLFLYDTIKFKIAIFTPNTDSTEDIGFSELDTLAAVFPDLYNYYLAISYMTDDNIFLIKNMNNIVQSAVVTKLDPREGYNYYYLLRQVPLIRYSYLYNDTMMEETVDLIDNVNDQLEEILEKIHNNYSLSIKFYNTYGPSRTYYIGSTGTNYINRIAISLKFRIKLTETVDTELDTNIRNTIIEFIEETNSDSVKAIYMSDIVNLLRSTYDEIIMIEFLGFNDYDLDKQTIIIEDESLLDEDSTKYARYIPEYINIFRKYVPDSSGTTYYVHDISITYLNE